MDAGIEQLKQGMRAAWMAGDFGLIARHSAKDAEEFVARVGVKSGERVLDVACGTGNLTIPAARMGGIATGVDIAPNLVVQARERAAGEKLDIRFDEGDAEQLPYPDGSFDLVMSMFGAMFAPRPEVTAAELIRVCRPGGRIAMANWTPEGMSAKVFRAGARFVPPPPGVPSSLLWGDEKIVRERLAQGTSSIVTTRRKVELSYPFPPGQVVEFFRKYFGPVQMTFERLDAAQQAEYGAALEEIWSEYNQGSGGETRVSSEYLEVIATRA